MDPLWFFFVLLRASFLSLGGQTGVPLLRADLVGGGVMSDVQLIQALTIGRLGTGPGGLYIVAIGYMVMGWAGASAGPARGDPPAAPRPAAIELPQAAAAPATGQRPDARAGPGQLGSGRLHQHATALGELD